ncbi:unnamed protein product [Symbiodinium microadriaticum]|nr:unnamed protein product [Symbiodinium microadriaticum]
MRPAATSFCETGGTGQTASGQNVEEALTQRAEAGETDMMHHVLDRVGVTSRLQMRLVSTPTVALHQQLETLMMNSLSCILWFLLQIFSSFASPLTFGYQPPLKRQYPVYKVNEDMQTGCDPVPLANEGQHQVSAARLPTDAARLPVIQAVFPQPQGSHALCIASPEWETSGAIVAVDCRSLDGRLFALHLVGRVTRGGLLIAAQIPEDADVTVYIGNQPWPLVDGPSVDLIPGELFFITPSGAPHHVVVSLQDMLVSPGGWTAFAHRGVSVRAVIAALNHTNFLPSQHSRPAICFVDARNYHLDRSTTTQQGDPTLPMILSTMTMMMLMIMMIRLIITLPDPLKVCPNPRDKLSRDIELELVNLVTLLEQSARWAATWAIEYGHRFQAPEDSHNRCLPLWPSILFKHPLCAWAWMAHLRSPALPTLFAIESEAHRMQSQQLHSVQAPSFGIKQTCQIGKGIAFSFKLVSYNTLTLFDPTAAKGRAAREHVGLMIRGKRDLMKQQFLHANTWLIGLQETRLPETGTLPDKGFLMISSAATSEGSYGCALWVNLAQPFAYIGRTPCRAAREDIVVSSFSPRHLQVQIDTPWIRFTVLVAHGPSAIRNDDQAKLFWEQRRNELARRPEGSEVLLLVDANSCLGSIPSAAVGQHAQEAESAAGFHFHSFLLDVGCLLPATFADWHTGQSWTWTAPGDNPVRHRIDYVGVPERPSSEPTLTQRATVVATLSRAPQISWELDVDGHFSQLVPLLQQSVSSAIPDSEQTPQQPYLSVDTLQLVRWRSAFRAYIRVENAEQRRRLLSVIFAALYHHAQGTVFNPNTLALVPGWLAQIDISIARAVAALEELTNRIRRAIKLDRAAYLQGLVQNLSLKEVLQPKKLYAAVRKAFPQARSSRRSLLSPLPAIRMADGSLACSAEERNERWRGYFAEQEAGDVLTDSTYAEFFLHPDIPVQGQHTAFSVAALPTLSEVESSILSLKFRKASGPDGITAEILRIAPQAVAVTLYPLFLKATLAVREPVEWHGGNLIALAKRATKALECSGYRSTLLASVVGKIHHKILRSKLEPYLGATKSGLQAGTSAGVGVDMISLAVKAFRGVEEHLTALVSDLFRGTWFRLESSSTLTGTRRGTRPGDPLADLLFGFSFAGYLRSIDTTLAEAGLATTIPAAAESPPWWDWEPTTNTNHASWADDYVHLQLAEDQAQLVRHVLLSTRLHVEKASAVGMSLTFAKDKSAVLLSSRLDRSCIFEASTNEVGDWGFPIRDSVSGITHFLPIVDSYRHLGGILTANHRPGVDLAFRVAQASSVAKPLRKRLFGSQSIPLSVRCTILRSLVVSKFSFSCATADLHSAIHRRSWCQHYVNFWRMLCKRRFGQKPAHCYEVLHITGAPPPLLALAQARYTLIRRLLSFGPPDLLHMLHVHWRSGAGDAWLLQILADLKAVAMYSESAATVLQMSCPIVSFFEAVQQEPLWWKRQLRKAVKGFADDVKQWALAYHTDEATVVSPAAPTEPAKPFKCRWCEQSFVLHKHVAVHEARRHGALSPARHFAFVPWCVACMRFYHTIERVQNHLRNSHACLQRCAQVIAPLSLPEVRELEQEGKTYKARIRKGAWHTYQAATPAAVALGPRMPTRDEVLSGLDEHEILLGRLARLFRPEPSTLSWVDETCQRHTPEGPRTGSAEFWLTRPTVASRTVSPRI